MKNCTPNIVGVGSKRDADSEWRRIHNEELHTLYRLANIVKVIKSRRLGWAGHIAKTEEGRTAFKKVIGKPKGKRPLGRPRRRCEDNIIMNLKQIAINARNLIGWAQDKDI